ncbi:hypothetical protein Tco_0349704 [Tanacetum coccineum]
MGLPTAASIKTAAIDPITNNKTIDQNNLRKALEERISILLAQMSNDEFLTIEMVRVLIDPEESNATDDFRGAPDELSGPDVIRPAAGRTRGKGPEFYREVIPPPCGPDDFLIGSQCLFNGPELVFFIEPNPKTPPDKEPIRVMECDEVFPPLIDEH